MQTVTITSSNLPHFNPTLNTHTVSSKQVAKQFGKRHDHVLRDIRETLKNTPSYFQAPNFGFVEESTTYNGLGLKVKSPQYLMTKDGFMLIVMGYRGEKANLIKIAYISQFNLMADELAKQESGNDPKLTKRGQTAVSDIKSLTEHGQKTAHNVVIWVGATERFATKNNLPVDKVLYSMFSPHISDVATKLTAANEMQESANGSIDARNKTLGIHSMVASDDGSKVEKPVALPEESFNDDIELSGVESGVLKRIRESSDKGLTRAEVAEQYHSFRALTYIKKSAVLSRLRQLGFIRYQRVLSGQAWVTLK